MKKKLSPASKAALTTGAMVAGAGALIGGRLGFSIAGFGVAHMVLGGADMIKSDFKGFSGLGSTS